MGGYAEFSPSLRGGRLIVRAAVPFSCGSRKYNPAEPAGAEVQFFKHSGFVTMTGLRIPGTDCKIVNWGDTLVRLASELWPGSRRAADQGRDGDKVTISVPVQGWKTSSGS